ncbi:transglycosylase domain-containing protein [Microbacterium sp. KUDC0406]|uniref:transglycosylase domain-containing protein n=1 Tax=Microbacterium sp. KUDC0406 TaxID=2909588 RepID=UPI001F4291A9|nr:transglycosylase domain-containing protein [Microbacterium sp. KUDC0406]UJP10385.1 transglycosylase domain-containing protein [Microbacterium sp. KUDC0406]
MKGVLGGLLGLVGLSAVAGLLVTATVTPAIAMAGFTGSQALTLFDELPSYLKPSEPMSPTTIYGNDANGKPFKLATFYEQNRTPVTFNQLSPTLVDALLSSEDKNFYSHGGVNLLATVKAVVENVRGTSSRGASTITQQFVKNVLIQQCEQDVPPDDEHYDDKMQQCYLDAATAKGSAGIERKLQEMRYAIQVEKDYSKNDILLGYLNVSNFGGTTYGIEAAANRYFSTTAAKVNLAQAATLAGMVQEPNLLRIDKPEGTWTDKDGKAHNTKDDGYETTKKRRDYVLGQMYLNGQITKAQYDEAKATPVTPKISTTTQGCASARDNAYFCQYALSVIKKDKAFGATASERAANLKRGGMQVYTSLDLRVQSAAVESVHSRVPAFMSGINLGGAAVSIEASTGRVLAIAQNTQFSESAADAKKSGISSQVFAADSAHNGANGFSVGSTYKLFTLIDWLEKGHSVNETLDGRASGTAGTYNRDGCGGTYTLAKDKAIGNSGRNSGYVGSVMRFTARSLNTGFLAMAKQLNLCDINQVAKRMGVHLGSGWDVTKPDQEKNPGANDPFPSVLGSKNIAPIQIAGAYATVANKGKYCEPRVIDKIIGQDGKEIAPPTPACSQVISPEVAATAAYALRGVMEGGTGGGANPYDGTQLIGKTGTAEKEHTMLVESSTKVTTAVWVGNIVGLVPLKKFTAHGVRLNDIRYGMAREIQRAANKAYGGDAFPTPDKNLTRRVLKDLPNVVGMSVDDAKRTLTDAGFQVSVGTAVDSDQPAGNVATQAPGAGQVAAGTTVTIAPSTGKPKETGLKVPDVKGKSAAEAIAELNGAGFTNINWDGRCEPSSKVADTDPAAGSTAQANQGIKVRCEREDGH